jgi:hypothetical protein
MGVGGQRTLRPLYPRERPDTHCIEGWVGPRAGLDIAMKYYENYRVIEVRSNIPV